ncbi:MAG: hypothetical protein AAF430_26310 [Myxococcota bacterium]
MERAALVVLALVAQFITGCAYSMIVDGHIDETQFQELTRRTAEARGLPIPDDVPARSVRKAEIPALLERLVREEYTPEELADIEDKLIAMGLWSPQHDYVEVITQFSGDTLAGLYIPDEATLYVVEDVEIPFSVRLVSAIARRDLMREFTLAHEIIHLLQHRAYPDLFEKTKTRQQADAVGSLQTAIEGDATRYGFVAVLPPGAALPDPDAFREELEAENAAAGEEDHSGSPAVIRLTLAFPYSYGYGLSLAEGSALLTSPPASTEQILHPEQRNADFWAIDLAPLEAALDDACRSLGQESLGELGLSVLFRDLADPEASGGPELSEVWEGWDGDRYLVADCAGQRELFWWTEWDSIGDAEEFAAAYTAIAPAVQARAEMDAPPEARVDGRRVLVTTRGFRSARSAPEEAARRARVATLDALFAHFGLESAAATDSASR